MAGGAMIGAGIFSISSAVNATLCEGANVSYSLAKDGDLPDFFDRDPHRDHRSICDRSLFTFVRKTILCPESKDCQP